MKLLQDLLYKAGIVDVVGSTNVAVTSVTSDSRKVERHSLFVALRGTASDGHKFIDKAIDDGAIAVLCEELPEVFREKVNYIKVKNTSVALAHIAANLYDNPSDSLQLVGVTGTNGKTTTATLLYKLFLSLGYKCGLISTVRYMINNEEFPSTHTTPDSLSLNALLRKMVDAGCKYCFMEVSSHAVVQHRVTALHFAGGIFTNITHDHLDYHKTFDAYLQAKKGFFDALPDGAFALVNRDDKNGRVMVQNTKARKYYYSLRSDSDFKGKVVENDFSGLLLSINGQEVWTRLIGSFNAYNLLAVYGAAILLKQDKERVLTELSKLESVEGRFQYLRSKNNITAVVDYAHTPDALNNVLKTIKDIRQGHEHIITVVGCGGDRDAQKRPLMAKIAAEHSDRIILTSDNPRSEDPDAIIDQMKKGLEPKDLKKTLAISDRKEAIRTACSFAQPEDIILIAGKGHEKYQEIKGVKYPFDDMQVVKETFLTLQAD